MEKLREIARKLPASLAAGFSDRAPNAGVSPAISGLFVVFHEAHIIFVGRAEEICAQDIARERGVWVCVCRFGAR